MNSATTPCFTPAPAPARRATRSTRRTGTRRPPCYRKSRSRTPATPCGESKAGGQDYLEALRQTDLVSYVRGVVTTPPDLSADVSKQDPFHVPSHGFGEGTTSAQLIHLVKQAEAGGGWAMFLFHGVGGDYLQVSDATHREFAAWLPRIARRSG